MSRASLADVVFDGAGKPLIGATIHLLRANDFATPPTTDPGSAFYVATTTSGAGGTFSFDHLVPDDYHLLVLYDGQLSFCYHLAALPVEVTRTAAREGRLLVPRTLERILAGESVVIHCVGDSITVGYNSTGTVGGGYVQRLGVLIGQQLAPMAQVVRYDPNAYGTLSDGPITGWNGPTIIQLGGPQVIQLVNNGVSGDTVQRVLRRIGNLTGWSPPIDLFVIYLGINDSLVTDSSKFVTPADFASGIRSLVEVLRTYYPQAELVLCTPHHNDQPESTSHYTLDEYAMATRRAALETGTALVDLRQLWQDHFDGTAINDGYGNWLDCSGGNHTHPTDAGHQAIAEEIFKIFGTPGLQAGRSQRIQTVGPRQHYKELEVVRLPNTNPALVFAGSGWSSYTPSALTGLSYSPSLMRASTAGNSMSWTGRCQDVCLLLRRGRDCGQIGVSIDGGPVTSYDLYRAYPTTISDTSEDGAVYPMDRLWIARGLAEGEHTVVVRVLGTNSPASAGSAIYLDGLEVTRWSYRARKVESPFELSQLQYGSFTAQLAGSYFGTVAVSFPRPFRSGNMPVVVASTNQVDHYCTVDSINNTGCTIRVVRRDGAAETATVTGQWLAVG
jgi:lysophospholipase L1-like esterase